MPAKALETLEKSPPTQTWMVGAGPEDPGEQREFQLAQNASLNWRSQPVSDQQKSRSVISCIRVGRPARVDRLLRGTQAVEPTHAEGVLGYWGRRKEPAFTTAVSPRKAVWQPDQVFDGASYADRYVIFFERMVRERLLDAACVVLADKDSATVRFPSASVSFQAFAAAIHGRCLQFMATNPDIDWPAGE